MSIIFITRGKVEIDDCDLEWASRRPWHLGDTGYAKCYGGRAGATPLRMHRLVMERILSRKLGANEYVDNINRDKLDNRRTNLRLATKGQNSMNRPVQRGGKSGYKGVAHSGDKRIKCWMSYITLDRKRYYLGRYYTEEEAAWMYDQWAIELHDDYSHLNFNYQ